MKHKILLFLKFGNYDNITDLYENGTIYLNTIEYFRKLEDKMLRGDDYEGASEVKNSLPGSFHIESINHTVNYQKIHIKDSFEEVIGNIFSLYCISSLGFNSFSDIKIDSKNIKFGTHVLMIKDIKYFIDKIQKELNSKGYSHHSGFVDYYDKEKISKQLTLFDKPLEFEYQKEFRFYVENYKLEPIILKLGSLKGHSEIHELKDLKFD